MRKARFRIDVISDVYVGYTNGQLWNGWSMPYLSKSEVLRFLANEPFDKGSATAFHWEGDSLIETDHDDQCAQVVPVLTINGETHYRIGNGWVWEEVGRGNQLDEVISDSIKNYIEYWSSDDAERDRMYRVLQNFMEEVYERPTL